MDSRGVTFDSPQVSEPHQEESVSQAVKLEAVKKSILHLVAQCTYSILTAAISHPCLYDFKVFLTIKSHCFACNTMETQPSSMNA